MKFMISGLIAATMMTIVVPGMAHASAEPTFSYRVVVPADAPCAAEAASMAKTFAAAASVAGASGTCEGEQSLANNGYTYKQNIIVVSYLAESPVVPVRAIFGGVDDFLGTTISGGLFPSYRACLDARASQLKLFTKYTGLAVVDSRCETGNDLTNAAWSLVIEGFGSAQSMLYGLSPLQFYDQGTDTAGNEVLQLASQMIQKYDGHVVYVGDRKIFYYSSVGEQVTVAAGPLFEKLAQCQSQLSEAQKIFNSLHGADVAVICHADNPSSIHLVAVGHYADQTMREVDADMITYASFKDCLNDRAREEQNLHSEGVTVYGVLCAPSVRELTGYSMHVYGPLF